MVITPKVKIDKALSKLQDKRPQYIPTQYLKGIEKSKIVYYPKMRDRTPKYTPPILKG